jgi:hypothetical protein
VRIGDVFVFVVGETLSQNLRAAFLPLLSKDGGMPLTAQQKELAASGAALAEIRKLLAAGMNAEASALYEKLPAGVKQMKSAALVGVVIASQLGDERYAAASRRTASGSPSRRRSTSC